MYLALIIALSVIAFLLIGFIVSYVVVNNMMFARFFERIKTEDLLPISLKDSNYDNYREQMKEAGARLLQLPHEDITITSKDGIKLSAKYYYRGSDRLIMCFHGVHSYPPYYFGVLGLEAYEKGYDLLIVDQRTHGQSEGDYITYGQKESDDVLCWLERIAPDNAKSIYMYGISMGASTLAFASNKIKDDRVKGLIVDCGFTSVGRMFAHVIKRQHVPAFLFGAVLRKGRKTADVDMSMTTEDCLKNTTIPVMFIHGDKDVVVPQIETERNYMACSSQKRIEIVKDAGHACATIVGGEDIRAKIFDFLGGQNE